jgi:drug/metabolite transporter (DMT)-like permease
MSATRPDGHVADGRPGAGPLMWIALLTVYVVWGSTYLAMRFVATSLPPIGAAAVRYGVAGVLLALVMGFSRGWRVLRIGGRSLASAALVGLLLLGGGSGLVMLAESPGYGLPSGVAALLVALNPLVMVVLRTAAGDRPRRASVAGALVGLAGLTLLFLPGLLHGGHVVPVSGALLVLGAVLCWCVGSFATRWLPIPADPFVASTYEMLLGAATVGLLSAVRGEPAVWSVPHVPARAWLALAYLIVLGSVVAFTAYVWLLRRAPISLALTYAYVNPVIALMLGALVAGEGLPARILLAATIVIGGVALVVSTETRTRPEPAA